MIEFATRLLRDSKAQCQQLMADYSHRNADVDTMHAYAECVELLHPPHDPSADAWFWSALCIGGLAIAVRARARRRRRSVRPRFDAAVRRHGANDR